MKSSSLLLPILLLAAITGCGGGGGGGGGAGPAPIALVSIAVTPANPSTARGATQQFSATGTFSDNTTQDLTASATWSSSASSVATVGNASGSKGSATSFGTGTTTITAASGGRSGSTALTVTGSGPSNAMPITVNGALCSSGSYTNKPCVSVTVCIPGTATCQEVTDLLLDTGSTGLRIFKQALTVSLPQVTVASGSLANCIQFGGGSSDWGPVQMASVILGNEPAVQVPIQVIDSTFGTRSTACTKADVDPATAGFNGILGVGLFAHDCGTPCETSTNLNYSACNGASCSGTTVLLAKQVQNPVALLPQDNNGVLVKLPSVPLGGETSVNGSLVLGIGTQSNNTPAAATAYPASSVGQFTTVFNGTTMTNSFLDTGSNGLYFNAPAGLLPPCPSPNTSFYCPASTTSLSATNTGAFGVPSPPISVSFQIGNFNGLTGTSNKVFSEVGGGGIGPTMFDWGIPFFYGRSVFVGIEGTTSSKGTGPYWAY